MNNETQEQNSYDKSEPPIETSFNNDLKPVIKQLANDQAPGKDQPTTPLDRQRKSYKTSLIFFVTGIAFCLIIFQTLTSPVNDGSGLIVIEILPLLLIAIISFFVSLYSFLTTYKVNKKR